jgi:hypothetical protein
MGIFLQKTYSFFLEVRKDFKSYEAYQCNWDKKFEASFVCDHTLDVINQSIEETFG